MSNTILNGQISFAFNGLMSTDPDFTYNKATQTLTVTNLSAGNIVYSGTALTSPTITGTILLGTSGSDTISITGTATFNTAPTFATNTKLLFRSSGIFIYSQSSGKLTISADGVGTDDITLSGTVTYDSAQQCNGAITVGTDGTGYDVTFYGDTAGKKLEWLQATDALKVTASTTMLGTLTVGVDDTGYDVTFFGATTGKYFLWDESADGVVLVGTLVQTGNSATTGTTTLTSASAVALTVGRQGATNPVLKINAATATVVTGIEITGAAATAGVAIAAISSGTNENITIDAKGSGTITLGGTSTGAIVISRATGITGAFTVTSASASALAVGRLGATTPAFSVDASAGTQTAGLKVTGAALNGTVAVVVTDTSGNTNLTINALGTGTIGIGTVSTGAVTITPATTITGLVTLTAGIATKVIFAGTETIAAGGTTTALDLTKTCHNIDADAGGDIFTLADGVAGQIMCIIMKSSTGVATITPATKTGYTSVTFNAAGDSVILQYYTTLGWIIMGGNSYAVV